MAIGNTAPELASMVIWLEKFVKSPDSVQLEPFFNATGFEAAGIKENDKSIKEIFLTNWVSSEPPTNLSIKIHKICLSFRKSQP